MSEIEIGLGLKIYAWINFLVGFITSCFICYLYGSIKKLLKPEDYADVGRKLKALESSVRKANGHLGTLKSDIKGIEDRIKIQLGEGASDE